jgi:hypothetical protein
MHPIGKLIIGIILVVGSIYYVWNYAVLELITVLKGAIPVIVFLLGIFIVWLELDELKIERELAKEEKKTRKKK